MQFLQFPCTILHVRCPLCLISSSVCLVAWLQCSKAGLDSASLRRRVPFIYFFLCPVCSLFASECIFWLIVACRGVHEEMKITVNTWQQAAAYLLLSFVTLAAIMLVCFSSIDVPGAEATVAVEGQWMDRTLTASHSFSRLSTSNTVATIALQLVSSARRSSISGLQDNMQNIGELQIRISLPTSRNRHPSESSCLVGQWWQKDLCVSCLGIPC